jgi:hypothetical protein
MREKYCWLIVDEWFVLRKKTAGWWLITETNGMNAVNDQAGARALAVRSAVAA